MAGYLHMKRGADGATTSGALYSTYAIERRDSYVTVAIKKYKEGYDWVNNPIDLDIMVSSTGGKPKRWYTIIDGAMDSDEVCSTTRTPWSEYQRHYQEEWEQRDRENREMLQATLGHAEEADARASNLERMVAQGFQQIFSWQQAQWEGRAGPPPAWPPFPTPVFGPPAGGYPSIWMPSYPAHSPASVSTEQGTSGAVSGTPPIWMPPFPAPPTSGPPLVWMPLYPTTSPASGPPPIWMSSPCPAHSPSGSNEQGTFRAASGLRRGWHRVCSAIHTSSLFLHLPPLLS